MACSALSYGEALSLKKKIAIVGTGIAGMACADRLKGQFDVRVFEKNNYVGGHTNTVEVEEEGRRVPIDTGFMVYNETTYPLLTLLFKRLDVPTKPTKMSFSVQHIPSDLEFAGTGWSGLFAQRRNIFRKKHWALLKEINRFNTICLEVLTRSDLDGLSLRDYCDLRGFSCDFRDLYLVPMSSAVWSSSSSAMLDFPAKTLVRFFSNHRFLSLHGQLAWRTVEGGSRVYRDKLIESFKNRITLNSQIAAIFDDGHHVIIRMGDGEESHFDAVVLATHADQALALIERPTELQRRLLGRWRYQSNTATLHTDRSVMPRARRAWTSWNYRVSNSGASTIYWMNSLQGVSKKKDYFISINGVEAIDPKEILRSIVYEHPIYSLEAVETQKDLPALNNEGRVYFCGSYFRYGFHEDALMAGLSAAESVERRQL